MEVSQLIPHFPDRIAKIAFFIAHMEAVKMNAVSYTHLDVYKRQIKSSALHAKIPSIIPAGSIKIISVMVITQLIMERTNPHILFFHNPIARTTLTAGLWQA